MGLVSSEIDRRFGGLTEISSVSVSVSVFCLFISCLVLSLVL